MQNLLTKKNLIIAVVSILIIVGIIIFFARKNGDNENSNSGGFFGLFPASEEPSVTAPSETPASSAGESDVSASGVSQTQSTSTPPIGTMFRITDNAVSSLVGTKSGNIRYHKNTPENIGHLFERSAEGKSEEKRLSNFTIPQITKVVWSPDATRALIFYNLDGEIRKILIDYRSTSTPKTNFLPDGILDAAFSPDSKSIAYINSENGVFIATSDFKSPKKITNSEVSNPEISWPSPNFLSLKTKSSYASRGYLYKMDIRTETLEKIAEGLGLDAVWSGDGLGVLYSTVNSAGEMQNLIYLNTKTGEKKEILIKTVAEKCAFLNSIKTVAYCGVPKLDSNVLSQKYPDSWWQGRTSFIDDFWLFDVATNQLASFIATSFDVINPKLMSDDSYLIFQDKISGSLWSLKLKI